MNILNRLEMYLEELRADPVSFLVGLVYTAIVLLTSLILHECAHGYVALRCGDPTAKMLGRLSLDPRRHLDPVGTACMLLLGFGWAKPVPVNPRNFKGNYLLDDFLVSIAGITVNFGLFLVFSAISVGLNSVMWKDGVIAYASAVNGAQALVNPYNYSYAAAIMYPNSEWLSFLSELMAHPWMLYLQRFVLRMAQTNLALAIFNFLPLPPLDGYHIFNDVILRGKFSLDYNAFRIAQLVLMVLLFTGMLTDLLTAANEAVYGGVLKLWMMIAGG